MAAVDRVVHHSVILDMVGVESYRVLEAEQDHLFASDDASLVMANPAP